MNSLLSISLMSSLVIASTSVSSAQSPFAPCGSLGCSENEMACIYECREPELTFKFSLPAWLPEQHGAVTVRGRSAPVHVSTREVFDLLDDIDNIYGGRLDVKYGPWGAFADGLYYDLTVSNEVLERIDLSAGFGQAIVDFAVTYDVSEMLLRSERTRDWEARFLVGGRYNLLEVDEITLTGPRGRSISRSGKRDWVDPIIGGQVRAPLAENLALSFRGDAGGFEIGSASHFTWNIEALAEYQYSECLHLLVGYRLLDIDQRQGSGDTRFTYDVQLKGPITRIVFNF